MRAKLLSSLLLMLFSGLVSAQDTIFVKNGQVIPAIIVEKNEVEIKYKRFGQPESAAIYSVFVSDILRIHYQDGIIADYTLRDSDPGNKEPEKAIEQAGTIKSVKFSLGVSAGYFNRNAEDELQDFWRYHTGDPDAEVLSNPLYFPVYFRMTFFPDRSGRNWFGTELQLFITPSDAINATNENGSDAIELKAFYYNIVAFYGRTLNHQRTLAAIIEPGLDLSFMSGYIKLDNTTYDISANLGVGFHMAVGADWLISKRLLTSFRAGYRFLSIEEQHKSESSSSGYSNFYTNPSVSEDLLTIKWNGPYVSLGLSWSFYAKQKFGSPE